MDLESECSTLESVEDNEVITPEILANGSENTESCRIEHSNEKLWADTKAEGVEVMESMDSPPLTMQSPWGSIESSPVKGYGLKKWRRIPREVNLDGGNNVDSSKILKRGLSNSQPNLRKPMLLSVEMKQKSEGSVSSINAMVKSPVVANDGFAIHCNNGLAGGPIFSTSTDSENSEDRSSKSSTAASVSKLRNEIPAVAGYTRDKNKMSLYGKNLGNLIQRAQQGNGHIETSKKPRAEQVKIEKENSHSSMESDSQSSNFVFMQGNNSVTSNGRQSGRSANYDGENSDEAQDGEHQFSGEHLTGFRENLAAFEGASQEDLAADLSGEIKEEKSDNHGSSTDGDPLVDSIITLQSAQEALEKELQKLRDIGKEEILLFDDSVQGGSLPSEFTSLDPKVHEPCSSDQLQSGVYGQSSAHSLEAQMISLKQNINFLESKLEEASTMLEVKKANVIEIEATLNSSSKSPKEETGAFGEMETDLEGFFKQKIEAEIEYLVISRAIQKLRVASVDHITLLEEQKILVSEQAQMVNKLEDAENHATKLKRQTEKLETYFGEIVGTDEVLKLQKRVCKFTSCFFIQLILLLVVLGLLVLQLSPHYAGVIPT